MTCKRRILFVQFDAMNAHMILCYHFISQTEGEATAEAIQKQYDRYFEANKVENGGSFYLQSKVYRAKELLDEYVAEKNKENQDKWRENEKRRQEKEEPK